MHPGQISPRSFNSDQSAVARQTAQDFFDALGKGDWDEAAALCPPGFSLADKATPQMKMLLTGLQVLSLGEPFTKDAYPGVFIPYEIRFKSGETKKYNLAVRQDNPARKWYFDGGL